jgi:hypothetical protein
MLDNPIFFTGMGSSIALGAGIPFLPVADRLINFLGSLNIILMASIVTGVRLILYAFIV